MDIEENMDIDMDIDMDKDIKRKPRELTNYDKSRLKRDTIFRKFRNLPPINALTFEENNNTTFKNIYDNTDAYFLFVCHGTTIYNNESNLFSYNSKINNDLFVKSVDFYVDNARILLTQINSIYKFIINPLKNLQDIQTAIKYSKENQYPDENNNIWLPPIVFSTSENDDTEFKNVIGLYLFTNNNYTKIWNWNNINEMSTNTFITYSQIFQEIKKQMLNYNTIKNIHLFIFCCRNYDIIPGLRRNQIYDVNYHPEIINKYVPDFSIKKYEEPNKYIEVYDDINQILPFYLPFDFDFNIEKVSGWTPLLNINHQGCALNVLSFYNIIPYGEGKTKVTCLTLKGTSIFKFIDYLDKTYFDSFYFYVVRFKINQLIPFLIKSLNYITTPNIVFVKMYTEDYVDINKTKESDVGHFISFYYKNNNIYLIDPQKKIIINEIVNKLDKPYNFELSIEEREYINYLKKITVFDVVFAKSLTTNINNNFLESFSYRIRKRPETIIYGGNISNFLDLLDKNIDNSTNEKMISFIKKLPSEFNSPSEKGGRKKRKKTKQNKISNKKRKTDNKKKTVKKRKTVKKNLVR